MGGWSWRLGRAGRVLVGGELELRVFAHKRAVVGSGEGCNSFGR